MSVEGVGRGSAGLACSSGGGTPPMRTLRATSSFLILPIGLAGRASPGGLFTKREGAPSGGNKPLRVAPGEPGSSVVADREPPQRSRPSTGRISGRVVDETGEPLPDVRVR